jgi:hypothetical protein
MQTTGSPTRLSSCHSQLDIAPVSKPIRSACGARLPRACTNAPGADLTCLERPAFRFHRRYRLPLPSVTHPVPRSVSSDVLLWWQSCRRSFSHRNQDRNYVILPDCDPSDGEFSMVCQADWR